MRATGPEYKRQMPEPPHNPFKLPFFLFCAGIGIFVAAVGLVSGQWWLAAAGLALTVLCLACAEVVRRGEIRGGFARR